LDIAILLTRVLWDQTYLKDCNGNLPLHIVASFDPNDNEKYHHLILLSVNMNHAACRISNSEGTLPLQLMDRSGKSWRHGMKTLLFRHPAAVLDLGLNRYAMCALLERVGSEKPDALFRLLVDAPALVSGVQYRM
jgi:hypothetical protein